MSRSSVWSSRSWLVGAGGCIGLCACGLDTDIPHRGDGASPANSGVVLSGVVDPDAGAAPGVASITDIRPGSGGDASALPSLPGALDSAGAADQSAGGSGGAAHVKPHGGASAADAGTGPEESAGSAGASEEAPPSLFFSEYVEGSSSYKALEIAAVARSNLEGCKVLTFFNGKIESTVVASLSGVLEAGQVLTVCSSSLQAKLGAAQCDQVGNLTFNGDDAIALSCAGEILDVIGQPGLDPGTAWGNATNSTLDHTLRRACSVNQGVSSPEGVFDPSPEWQALPVDTFSGLGTRGC